MRRIVFLLLAMIVMPDSPLSAADPSRRPMQLADLFAVRRIAEPQLSPDGKLVVYQQTEILDFASNKMQSHLWLVASDGSVPPRQLTSSGKRDSRPRWSPDGREVLFESNRSGSSQLWILNLTTGGEARQLTAISTGASTGVWSPDGSRVAFVSEVLPEFSTLNFDEADKKNQEREDASEKSPVKAKVFTKLFFRHWDSYVGDKRQHLFVIDATGQNCRNVTPGDRDANPTSSTFSMGDDFTFSPDGKHLIFTAVPAEGEAWTTNHDLCRVSITNTSPKWETLTKNLAADSGPKFSPDGKYLAFRSQRRAGYEADRWELMMAPATTDGRMSADAKSLTPKVDWSVDDYVWKPGLEGRYEFGILTEANARKKLIWLAVSAMGEVTPVEDTSAAIESRPGQISSFTFSRDGKTEAFAGASMNTPAEVFVNDRNISRVNSALLSGIELLKPESVSVPVEGGVSMQMWILKPPGFDASKKWPVVYLVHGGPQGAWEDGWSYRWNPQAWAAQGYVIAMPNPRGSTGFGQKYIDEISGDWGGKCYRDLAAGVAYLEKLPYVDATRMGSAGGSFGGYMQNWFAVNDLGKKFQCLITHCSVWNFESMWGTTEELWFDEFEHGGLPWELPGKYREFSPHAKAGNLGVNKVPMLIIHNDLDFRCPIGQGHELFTALKRQGVPARFVNFPDEGHWVLKPANSHRWHTEIFGWLTNYVPPGGK